MTLRIITGTITDARDPFGIMQALYNQGIFYKWRKVGPGPDDWQEIPTRILSGLNGSPRFSIIQTTGSGKTVLAMIYSYEAHRRGIPTGGNLSLKWTKNNENKEKKYWHPLIQCMEDIEEARFMHITLDDIRGTITAWNAKEAKMVSEVANATRKKGNYIDITTQRTVFVPPDMRDIADEIIVPFIRVSDGTRKGPDGRDVPLEIVAFYFSAGQELIDYKIYNLGGETGQYILDSFNTLEIAAGLRQGEGQARINQPGYELEAKAYQYLKEQIPGVEWQHLNGKNVFDIISPHHAIDVVGTDPDGFLNIDHKDLIRHIKTAKNKGQKPFLMFQFANEWRFVIINHNLNEFVQNRKIPPANFSKNRIITVTGVQSYTNDNQP